MERLKAELNYLLDLTGIPTAAGCEGRVVQWIERWAKARKNVRLRRDRFGNLYLTQTGRKGRGSDPVLITAHLDHPAFVVRNGTEDGLVELEFRGGVSENCFSGKEVEIFDDRDRRFFAAIEDYWKETPFPVVIARLRKGGTSLKAGDVGRWRLRGRGSKPVISGKMLYAPACDDLAGAAAALATFDRLRKRKGFGHVGVLLTLAEEVGFVGAYSAAISGAISQETRLICLENSRSFAESPIGGGPILRVGDRASVFSPDLTNRFTHILNEHQRRKPDFRWQRRLMPGGVCEATVFSELGYQSSCVCLALGNYHNMTDASLPPGAGATGGIGPEYISVEDYLGMIDLLQICIEKMDASAGALRDRLAARFEERKHVLGSER